MPANPNLFADTLSSMDSGDTLLLMGGTFPGKSESTEVRLGLRLIIPILHIVTGRDEYAPRDNLVFGREDEDPLTVTIERNDIRFGHDYGDGPDISHGKRAGVILGHVVDLVILGPMSRDSFYFVAKPSTE